MAEFGDRPENMPADGQAGSAARASDLGPALRDQASKLADKSVSTGVEAAQAVGRAAETAAQALDEALPMLAGYVRQAAQQTNQFADSLRDKKAEDLLSTAVTWSKQQPLLTLAGATLLGFALSRVVKTGATSAPGGDTSGGDSGSEKNAGGGDAA